MLRAYNTRIVFVTSHLIKEELGEFQINFIAVKKQSSFGGEGTMNLPECSKQNISKFIECSQKGLHQNSAPE